MMNFNISKPNATTILAIVLAGCVWLLLGFSGEQQMTRVGGTMNHCTCTQRLER